MATNKKTQAAKTAKSKVKVRDLKSTRNPKGGVAKGARVPDITGQGRRQQF